MRGDLLFYVPDGFVGRLVARWTGGPYCHVEIDLGDGTAVGAHSDTGICRYAPDRRRVGGTYRPGPGADVDRGLAWALRQVGKRYGWADILNAACKYLRLGVYLGEPGHYDCSDFATRYLCEAHDPRLPDALAQEPHLVTPNDLWRALSGADPSARPEPPQGR